MTVGKNITYNKGKVKARSSALNIMAVGRNIKWGRGEGDGNFEEENQDFKTMGVGKNIKL